MSHSLQQINRSFPAITHALPLGFQITWALLISEPMFCGNWRTTAPRFVHTYKLWAIFDKIISLESELDGSQANEVTRFWWINTLSNWAFCMSHIHITAGILSCLEATKSPSGEKEKARPTRGCFFASTGGKCDSVRGRALTSLYAVWCLLSNCDTKLTSMSSLSTIFSSSTTQFLIFNSEPIESMCGRLVILDQLRELKTAKLSSVPDVRNRPPHGDQAKSPPELVMKIRIPRRSRIWTTLCREE